METMICKECGKGKPLTAFSRNYSKAGEVVYRDVCQACVQRKQRRDKKARENREMFFLSLKHYVGCKDTAEVKTDYAKGIQEGINIAKDKISNLIKKYEQ